MSDNSAYQEQQREELIGGRIVAMSPAATNHNRITRNISRIFSNHLHGKPCEPFGDGESVFLTQVDHFVPDFMVVCDPSKVKWNGIHGAPDLVVEVLSPNTAGGERSALNGRHHSTEKGPALRPVPFLCSGRKSAAFGAYALQLHHACFCCLNDGHCP